MAGATFSRLKNWAPEILTNTDLNAEIDNILNNLGPAGVDDYSTTAAQMKLTTNPGSTGSESLATSLAGELERLRYAIQQIKGSSAANWYDAAPSTISDLVNALGSVPGYRIISGRTTGNSSQLCALIPSGSTSSVTLSASATPFSYYIGGVAYSITANVTLTGLSLGPSANNTCSLAALDVNVAVAGQQWTKVWGHYGTKIPVNGMNSSIASNVGQVCAFKTGTEYFVSYVNSTTQLTNAWRGSMFNSSANNVSAAGLTHGDEIKLLKLAWIFANTSQSLAVTYTNPSISATQPTSPNTGDYWFDLGTTAWKTFNSTSWVFANATIIGITMQDTAACVAARTIDAFKPVDSTQTLSFKTLSNTQVQAADEFTQVSVCGQLQTFQNSRPIWDTALHLDAGAFSPSTTYYFYMKETGLQLISQAAPIHRRDLRGLYHPGETWRCLGSAQSNASTQFQTPIQTFRPDYMTTGMRQIIIGFNSNIYGTASYTARADNNNQGEYFSTEYLQNASVISYNVTVSATFTDSATVSLSPGLWVLNAVGELALNAGTALGSFWQMCISTASGNAFNDSASNMANSITGLIQAPLAVSGTVSGATPGVVTATAYANAFRQSLGIPRYVVRVNSLTNYVLKSYVQTVSTAAATLAFRGHIHAERLDSILGGLK